MAVAFMIDFSTMAPEQADTVIRILDLKNKPAPGQIFHIDGPWEGGVRVVDVWESMELFEQFAQERLIPAFQQAGVQGTPPTPQPWPVRNMLK